MATSSQLPYDDLLDVLREIASGLKDPKSRSLATEVPAEVAANHLDYLAIQELLGRRGGPRDPENSVVFAASRTQRGGSSYSTIRVFDLPPDASTLAVFTARGAPTETIDRQQSTLVSLRGAPPAFDFELTDVKNHQAIIRLELQRSDGYPVRLGPRLPAV
ncbi:hypothetical protein [Agromyces bauzanensis]